jgi:hypothetical protein
VLRRFEASELDNQRGFHKSERDWFDAHPELTDGQFYKDFQEHVRLFDERVKMLQKGMQATPKVSVPGSSEVVGVAAKWIAKHRPAHDPEPYGDRFVEVATRFYRRLRSRLQMGDGLRPDWRAGDLPDGRRRSRRGRRHGGVCSCALYEAQAQRHGSKTSRQRFYPDRLEPTVKDWSTLYA